MAVPARLGPYQILPPLASGGREKYRARDNAPWPRVALNILPSELYSHSERLQRFERKARAARLRGETLRENLG